MNFFEAAVISARSITFLHVPRGMAHHFKNTGDARMVTVHIYGPGLTPGDTVRVP